jgi:uncharacterized protein (DUF1499 family)
MGPSSGPAGAPGVVSGSLAACPASPNCVSSEAGTPESHRVAPLPKSSWARASATITAMGGVVTQQSDDYITAEFTSLLMRYVDDVELRLANDAVHVRSASRVGYSDMGANRARVATLRQQLGAQ